MIDSGALPIGWSLVPLGELLTAIDSGKSFKCEERPPEAHEVGVIKVSAVSWGEYQESESKTCVDVERIEPAYFVRQGDFLFSRANTIELVGACVIAGRVSKRLMLSDKILRLHFATEDLKPWVLQYLRSKAGRDQIERLSSGNQESMRNIGQERLKQIQIPLPPSNERESVSFKLDELLSQLAAASDELSTAQRKLNLFRQSLLKSAVEGSLTHKWRQHTRTQETGNDLHARLLRERQARWEARQLARLKALGKSAPKDWRDRYEPGANPETSNLPSLPDGWVYASIGQCFEVAVGATPSRKVAEYWGGDVPWISSGEVSFNRIAATRETISDAGLTNSSTQINPAGSLLLGMIGEGKTRGQVAILDIPAANNQNCAAIWVSETNVPPEFVYFWLWSRYDETRRGSSGNNQPALNKSLVQAMPVPLAPIEEMREIAERVGVQFAGIEAQEREIDRLLRMAAAQRQSILRAAFSGQLVPQDPNDEPASVLLDRIRAQRQAAVPSTKRKAGRPAKAIA